MGLLLGFDFGSNKIGVAIGQTITNSARALTVIKSNNGVPKNWQQIADLIKQYKPDMLVVGLPLNMDDSVSEISIKAQQFARRLHGRFNLPVKLWDERLTSFEARGFIMQSKSKSNQKIDAVAAALILQGFLDNSENLLSFQSNNKGEQLGKITRS